MVTSWIPNIKVKAIRVKCKMVDLTYKLMHFIEGNHDLLIGDFVHYPISGASPFTRMVPIALVKSHDVTR